MNEFLLGCAAVGGAIGAATGLWNSVQIGRLTGRVERLTGRVERLTGRVDALEGTMHAVIAAVLGRDAPRSAR